jgi:hypothetical protein
VVAADLCLPVFLMRFCSSACMSGMAMLRSEKARGDFTVVAKGLGLFGVLWCDPALECSWGTSLLLTVRCPRSWVRGMGSLFRLKDRELVSFLSLESDLSSFFHRRCFLLSL